MSVYTEKERWELVCDLRQVIYDAIRYEGNPVHAVAVLVVDRLIAGGISPATIHNALVTQDWSQHNSPKPETLERGVTVDRDFKPVEPYLNCPDCGAVMTQKPASSVARTWPELEQRILDDYTKAHAVPFRDRDLPNTLHLTSYSYSHGFDVASGPDFTAWTCPCGHDNVVRAPDELRCEACKLMLGDVPLGEGPGD